MPFDSVTRWNCFAAVTLPLYDLVVGFFTPMASLTRSEETLLPPRLRTISANSSAASNP
jgi:hypothetical protein